MIKKIVIGGTAAALLVAGAASAAQLTGDDTTLANGQFTVSGAELKDIEFTTTYEGGGQGNGAKTAVVETLTLELDKAGVNVTGRILQNVNGGNDYATDVNGKRGGYLADSAATKFQGKVTDSDGKVTFTFFKTGVTDWQAIPVENVDAIDITVTG